MPAAVSASDIIVHDDAFAYLRLQRGKISNLAEDRGAWLAAYRSSLERDYNGLRPYLPKRCEFLLDVGSGLGGIDVLLSRHYANAGAPIVYLLDGISDPPEMHLHRHTFNDADVAKRFHEVNGSRRVVGVDPAIGRAMPESCVTFDLIVSLGSWGFHYEPRVYLDFVKASCAPSATLILDVRKNKPGWLADLTGAFGRPVAVLHLSEKFDRMVFRAPA